MNPTHCRPVPLPKAYRLLNHGPTVLVSAAHNGQRNIMAAAWAMPLDFNRRKSPWCWTLHHVAGGHFLSIGEPIDGHSL
jgi:hypothetical protein